MMAEDSESQPKSLNPCCIKRRERFLKVKEARDTLRSALKSVEPRIAKLQAEYEAERARADLEKEAKEKEATRSAGLEKEKSILKSKIELLQQNEVLENQDGGEVILLRTRVSELEGEIDKLKEFLEEERKKGDLERKRIETEKIKAEEACKVEKEARLSEAVIKAGLEDSLLNLKSEIALLKENKNSVDQDEYSKTNQVQIHEWEAEISRLTELLENERRHGEIEKKKVLEEKQKIEEALKNEVQARSKESSIKADLEKEILDLKSLIASSPKKRSSKLSDGEIILLETRVSEAETERNRLKECIDQEKKKGASFKKKAQEEMKKAKEAWRIEAEAKESSTKASLENEILNLKSQIAVILGQMNSSNQEKNSEVVLLQTRLSEAEVKSTQLKEFLDQEKGRAYLEKRKVEEAWQVEAEARSKESAIRAGLEKEISDLKSQIALLVEQRDSSKISCEILMLQTRVSEAELESNRLKELLEEEKIMVDLQKVKAAEVLQVEAETKSKESAIRAGLEKENFELKSQIALRGDEIALLQIRVSEAEAESNRLKELCDQESKRAKLEKKKAKAEKKKVKASKLETEKKLKESATLENEILKLKSEIASLHEKMSSTYQREGNEAFLLRSRVTEADAEIHRLSDLLEMERSLGDFEKNRAEVEQKKASEVWKILTSEKNKVEEERRLAIFERSRAEECKLSLDSSQAEANELREKLISIKKICKRLEDEKQIADREKKHAQSEKEKAEELKKCIEVAKMKLLDEKKRSDCLSQKLDEAIHRSESLEKELQVLMSATKMKEDLPIMSAVSKNEDGNLMLLEKQLKLEKRLTKHAKKVARFEKARNNLLKQELDHLKQEFFQFGYRINALNGYFSTGIEGIDASAEMNNTLKLQPSNVNGQLSGKKRNPMLGKSERELVKARYTSMDGFDPSAPLSDGSGSSTKPISGIIGGSVRNKLQNSAIYSTSTSFSDRQSVGSQENNILSLSRPENFKENMKQGSIPRLSAEGTNLRVNGDLVGVAENRFWTPARRDVENLHPSLDKQARENGSKRMKLSHGVEAVGCLSTELRSIPRQMEERWTTSDRLILDRNTPNTICSQIDGKLNALGDGSSLTILLDDMHAKNCRTGKNGKVSLKQKSLGCKADANEATDNLESEVMEHVGIFPPNVSDANCLMETVQSCRNEIANTTEINHDTEVSFEKMIGEDIMVLFELDDPDEEERFRMAMEMPLSPTLPEIEIPNMEAYKLNDSIILEEGTCKIDNDDLSHSVDVMNVEINSNKLKFRSHDSSSSCNLKELDSSGCTIREPSEKDVGFCVPTDVRNMAVQISMSSTKMEVANKAYQNVAMKIPLNGEGHECENMFKHFVVFPTIKDKNIISRIVSACETCMSEGSTASQKVWMVKKVLVALANEKSLLPEERACVFFSALLHNFLVITTLNYQNFLVVDINSCSDSFLTHMKTVMSDLELRNILLGLFELDTLLSLIEGFLINKRVMLYKDASQQSYFGHDSQNIELWDGTSVMISSEMASTDKLIAGSSILASICAITGHIGFVCEVSYKFLLMHRSDSYLTLAVLHVFASVCGSKYFNLRSHSLIMTVVMSVVTLLEGENTSTNATNDLLVQCGSESRPRFSPCPQCAFSRCAASMDEVLNLLLTKLQNYAIAMIGYQANIDIVDVLSLVELLAYYMNWDWTCSKVISQLLNMVEACVSEKVSAAILLLIGQLGRFRIDKGGYELQEVEQLRCRLAVFLRPKNRNWSLHTQLAIVHALIGLLAVDFADLVKDGDFPPDISKCIHANLVRSWFFQLTEEQKSSSFEILRSANMPRN